MFKDMNAIDKVRQMVADGQVSQEVAEKYFPELKERDGGKIRERLIAFLTQCKAVYGDSFKQFELNIDEALDWLEKQGEQKSTWDEDDKLMFQCAISHFECQKRNCIDGCDTKEAMQEFIDWLNSLKDRFGCEVNSITTKEWSEDDEQYLLVCKNALVKYQTTDKWDANIISRWLEDKLKSLKDRVQPQQEWSEDKFAHIVGCLVQDVVANEHMAETEKQPTKFFVEKYYKILRPHSAWEPSEEMLEALYRATQKNVKAISEDEMLLDKLYQGLKYGIISKN